MENKFKIISKKNQILFFLNLKGSLNRKKMRSNYQLSLITILLKKEHLSLQYALKNNLFKHRHRRNCCNQDLHKMIWMKWKLRLQ